MIFVSFSFIRFWVVAEAGRYREERRAAAAEADALRAELQRLRLQLNPHFLLNALNGIGDLIPRDPLRARGVVEDLAVFLRHALSDRASLITTVGEEIDVVSAYLGVQSSRFGNRLDATLDVEAAGLSRRIAGFLLQPLVENAVEHGHRRDGVKIMIRLQTEGERLLIDVRNPGRLRPGRSSGTGIGLANVRDRLALHYPDRHVFQLREEAGAVVASLVLDGAPCSGS
jgi:LytS/YehU family sensor histidine kinase